MSSKLKTLKTINTLKSLIKRKAEDDVFVGSAAERLHARCEAKQSENLDRRQQHINMSQHNTMDCAKETIKTHAEHQCKNLITNTKSKAVQKGSAFI